MNPPAALAGAMGRERKPFSYLPGGLDLSQIKSERMAQRLMRNAMNQGVPEVPVQQIQSPPTPSTPVAVPNYSCLPVQVLPPGFSLPANPKSLLRSRSNPDRNRAPPQKMQALPLVNQQPTSQARNDQLQNNINKTSPQLLQTNTSSYSNRPTSMFEYGYSPSTNTLPQTNYGSDGNTVQALPEISYDAEYLTTEPRNYEKLVDKRFSMPAYTQETTPLREPVYSSNTENPIRLLDFNANIAACQPAEIALSPLYDSETHKTPFISEVGFSESPTIEPITLDNKDEKVPIEDNLSSLKKEIVDKPEDAYKESKVELPEHVVNITTHEPVECKLAVDVTESSDEQKQVTVVKKQVKKEKKVEESENNVQHQNGDQNGDAETELVVKLPSKKSGTKVETKVEVLKKSLPDGSVEEITKTTTKTTTDGKTSIKTTTETKIIPKEELSEEEVEEEEENEDVEEVEEEPKTVIVKKAESTATTTSKKVVVVESNAQDSEEEVEEAVEPVKEVEKSVEKSEVKKVEVVEADEEEEEEGEEEEEVVVKKVAAAPEEQVASETNEEEEEEEAEEEVVVVAVKKPAPIEPKAEEVSKKEEEAEQEEEVEEEEEYEEAEDDVKKDDKKPDPKSAPIEESKAKEEDDESEYTEEEIESEHEEEAKSVPVEKTEPSAEPEHSEPKVEKSEPKEEKPDVASPPPVKPEQKVPLREPSIPLEKVEDVEIKPIGAAETVSKTHTENTEIITSSTAPAGSLSTQTEYNRVENIVTVNRTTKTLDNSYEQITQSGIPTMKTYFAPNRERISTSPQPSKPYQPAYYTPEPPKTERRHSLLLDRLSTERQMPGSEVYQNSYSNQYSNQTYEQQKQWSQEPQSEIVNVSNVKPSTITNSQWYQQNRSENVIYNNLTPTTAPPASQLWNQPQQQQPQAQSQQPQAQSQYQPSYAQTTQDYSNVSSNTYQQNSYPSYTPKPSSWGNNNLSNVDTIPSINVQSNNYSTQSQETQSYQKSSQQYSSSYVPPPWEQDPNYVAPATSSYFQPRTDAPQPAPTTNTFSPNTHPGWTPTLPKTKYSKPPPTAYVPPAPNQSFVKNVNIAEPPPQPGRKTYYSEYERRYITVPESNYVPGESKFQAQPDPSPQYYYDNNEQPAEQTEPQWRKELREFTEKTSQTQYQSQQTSVNPPWESEPNYTKTPTVKYNPTPSWSQTLRPQSWRERSFESELVSESQEWAKSNTLGRSRPLSSYVKNTEGPIPERTRGVSVDRYNPNNYQAPIHPEHPPVQAQTLTPGTAPHPKGYHNPNVPAYHARASAEPREPAHQHPRVYAPESRASPLQSRSFKYLQWITGTEE